MPSALLANARRPVPIIAETGRRAKRLTMQSEVTQAKARTLGIHAVSSMSAQQFAMQDKA